MSSLKRTFLSLFSLFVLLVLFVVVFVLLVLFMATPASASAPRYAEGEALVVLKNETGQKLSASAFSAAGGTARNLAASAASAARANVLKTYPALSEASNLIVVHMKSDSQKTETLIADLQKNPAVLSAAPNYVNRSSRVPNDAKYGELWGMKRIRADEAWDTTTGSSSIYIAVVDSGVQTTHPDLSQNLVMDLARSFSNQGIAEDTSRHGTHVIGTVGAAGNNGVGVTGVNWRVGIIPIQIFTGDEAHDDALIDALNYLEELQRSGDTRIYAVNLSLGSWRPGSPEDMARKNDALYLAYKRLDETNKTVIVVAAGNEGMQVGVPAVSFSPGEWDRGDYIYPASYIGLNNMIVVGATDQNDKAASFTNWSPTAVDIAAPGTNILSTVPASSYELYQGTSMAVPHVTGAVSLIASKTPSLTASELKALLLENANDGVNPPAPKTSNSSMSRRGLLDVKAALDATDLLSIPVDSISITPSEATLTVGEQIQLSAILLPVNATSQNIEWSSDNPEAADVDETGMTVAVGTGKATITATAQEGGLSGMALVSVEAQSFEPSGENGRNGCNSAGWSPVTLFGAIVFASKRFMETEMKR